MHFDYNMQRMKDKKIILFFCRSKVSNQVVSVSLSVYNNNNINNFYIKLNWEIGNGKYARALLNGRVIRLLWFCFAGYVSVCVCLFVCLSVCLSVLCVYLCVLYALYLGKYLTLINSLVLR